MIPVYNCAAYLPQALQSVLEQDLGVAQMQIEVVDDCSTDADVGALVEQIGKGRVQYYKQHANVGSLRNFETCINRAKGQYVHLLHGDDYLKPGYYQQVLGLFQQFPEAGAAFCAFDMIKSDGTPLGASDKPARSSTVLPNWLHRLAERPWLQYACIIVRRSVYEQLGAFYLAAFGEDWEMWVRIAKHYPVAYTPESLAVYRVHTQSITGQSVVSGSNLQDIGRIIQAITAHLPENDRAIASRNARKYFAYSALNGCSSIWYRSGNRQAVQAQIREAFRLYRDPLLFYKAAQVKTLMLVPRKWLPALRKIVKGSI